MTIQIIAVMAEQESRLIAERTKAAMAAAKIKGRRFGTPANLDQAARQRGSRRASECRKEKARGAYSDLAPVMREMRSSGMSLRRIASALNDLGHRTRRQCPWTAIQAQRVLARYSAV